MSHTLENSSVVTSALRQLTAYKTLIDDDLTAYSHKVLTDWHTEYGQYSFEALRAYCDVLDRGGKRLRGALVLAAYQMLGGTDMTLAMRMARVVEMVHAYVLIIDDIADRSDMRRSGPSAHRLLERYHRDQRLHGDSEHFGVGMAMHSAIAGSHLALREMGDIDVPPALRMSLMNALNDSLLITVNGQFNDIFNEALQEVDEAQVKRVLTWKTAYYSFLNPLQMGAMLAGASAADCAYLEEYSINAGLSFQLTDDILGTFGDSFESGKSAQDDLKEGKITLLVARALGHASPDQKRHLLSALGNQDVSADDYQNCRLIIEDTGALDYVRSLAETYAMKAAANLAEVPAGWHQEHVDFLRGITSYITQRQN